MRLRSGIAQAIAAATLLAGTVAQADWAPDGPIKFVSGFGTGGSVDALARKVAEHIEDKRGWDVVVENRPGGGGVAMFSQLAHMDPDGQTIGIGVTFPIMMNLVVRGDKLPFDNDSFDYLGTVAVAPLSIVARADAPFDTFPELLDHARETDGATLATGGPAQEMVVAAVEAQSPTGLKSVPHKSGAASLQSILGGHVDAGFSGGAHVQYVEAGDMKVIASATKERDPTNPDRMTLVEHGYPYWIDAYFHVAAPAGLPEDARSALEQALDEAVSSEEVAGLIRGMSQRPVNVGGEATAAMMREGTESVLNLVEASGRGKK
ncbi:tripartite tricarboxylate transporter substrate binding protein [Rhodosalinus halophilus]|uniref:Tripartite tricarboxylate transporter substrate binding protein n=1 Tax=Rhodosalinus halophilus TaxID=2259333 RepID=A0A365U6J9_9RHOB|nr:tripartite tricarboxylate transporter substrate binding protein [Rhodosalinus halophilus]RBI83773.1 tripartite tricarboxylate transporter substrate binding protein [Rhodosalinus halophilus]